MMLKIVLFKSGGKQREISTISRIFYQVYVIDSHSACHVRPVPPHNGFSRAS